jgi:hypothetical protein
MQSHTQVVAVPTAADAWTSFSDIVVPAGAQRLSKVIVGVACDEADPAGVRIATVFRLLGSGLLEQSPHQYVGPAGNITTKTTSGAYAFEGNVQQYDVDIPVAVGGSITPQVNTPDEAITAGTCSICLVFDSAAPSGRNSMSDYVDAAMTTTAGAWATVGTLSVPQLKEGKAPVKITEIVMAIPTDQATLALLRCASRFRLSGAGIAEGGIHELLGPQSGTGCSTAGILGYSHQLVRCKVEIPVNAGGQILVEQHLTTETPTAGTAILGVMYA